MEYESICIFTLQRTYTFKGIRLTCDNEYCLVFLYTAQSDGRVKIATFPKSTICGWSLTVSESKSTIGR